MEQERTSFVLWIDRETSREGRLIGSIEWTCRSERVRFGSTAELLRFIEQRALSPSSAETQAPHQPTERTV